MYYESTTNWTAIIVGIVIGQAVVCAIASGFIASAKNRGDEIALYATLGFLFRIIGVIIAAAVPALDEKPKPEARSTVVNESAPVMVKARCICSDSRLELTKGALSVEQSRIVFAPFSGGTSLSVPFLAIEEMKFLSPASFPQDMPFRKEETRAEL